MRPLLNEKNMNIFIHIFIYKVGNESLEREEGKDKIV